MAVKLEVIQLDRDRIGIHPSCTEFERIAAYVPNSISYQFALAAAKDGFADPDTTALALVRVLIQNSDRLRRDQKFVLLTRFWAFGEVLTLDLVSLDEDEHWQIVRRYLSFLGVTFPDDRDFLVSVPYIITGGLVSQGEEVSKFGGTSADFGNKLFGVEANHLASYLLGHTPIGTDAAYSDLGKELMRDVFELILEFKRSRAFYERLYDALLERRGMMLYPQNLGALIAMKVCDRTAAEGGDFNRRLLEELVGCGDELGLGPYMTAKVAPVVEIIG